MKLTIDVHNERNNPEIEDFVHSRLEMVVGRFHERLGRIQVRLLDENAHKGGVDKTCNIDAAIVPRGKLHVHASESGIREAILKAIHRLEAVLAKTIDRGHRSDAIRHRQGGLRHLHEQLSEKSSLEAES